MDAISQWLVAMGVSPLIGGAIAGALVTFVFLRLVAGDQSVKALGAYAKPAAVTPTLTRDSIVKNLLTDAITSVRFEHNGQSIELSERESAELVAAIRAGHIVDAIKLVRNSSGLGLKEAKDIVDTMNANSVGRS